MSKSRRNFSNTKGLLDKFVADGLVAGVSLQVTRHGETILATQTGYADLAGQKKINPDTIFRIFSMTKPVTAVALLILYEKGLLHLNDRVSDYLPGFKDQQVWFEKDNQWQTRPAKTAVTLRQLLTMTSGVPYQNNEHPAGMAIGKIMEEHFKSVAAGQKATLADLANQIGQVPLVFDPGTAWLYGLSIDIIGAVIEVVSGVTLGQFLKENIFLPLNMLETGFLIQPEHKDRLATIYQEKDGQLQPSAGNPLWPGEPDQPPLIEMGGAGLFSTRSDYTRFARMLLGKGSLAGQRILSSRSVELLASNHLNQEQLASINWATLQGFGYGLAVRSLLDPVANASLLRPGEFGWDGAAGTWFSVNPHDDMTIVYMVQRLPADHMRFIPRLQATIYAAL